MDDTLRRLAAPAPPTTVLAAPLAPLWTSFLAKSAKVRGVEGARELRWAFEELRVAIFAPELKTPVPVSAAKVAAALAALK